MALPEDSLLPLAVKISDGPGEISAETTAPEVPELPEGADDEGLLLAFKDIERVAQAYRSLGRADRREPTELPRRWGHLELREKLGEGAAAEVFRAHDTRLDHDVALKLFKGTQLTASEKRTVLEEGRRHARVKHGNIATIHDADEHEGRIGISMEYVDGWTLHELVDRQGAYGAGEAAHVGVELCRAAAAIHRRGLVHGDIKAQNVMREKGGRIVLMDFSTSRPLDPSPVADRAHTEGTPIYMAPELFEGGRPSPESDIYALGVLLFYLATGDYPAKAHSLDELRDRVRRGERQSLYDLRPDLPTSFVRTVERALSHDPKDRFPSAGALGGALSEAGGLPAPARLPGSGRLDAAAHLPAPVRAVVAIAGAVAFVGLLGFVTSTALNVTLGRPAAFAGESAADWLVWGLRSLIAPLAYMTLAVIAVGVVLGAWRALNAVGPVARGMQRLRTRASRALSAPSLGDTAVLAQVLFVAGFLALAAICWRHAALIDAFTSYLYLSSPSELDPLRPERVADHIAYGRSLDLLILAFSVAWVKVWRRWRRDRVRAAVMPLAGTVAVILAALLLWVVPYRILWHSEFEKVQVDGRRGYLLGQRQGQVLVYVPEAPPDERRVVIDEGDSRLRRLHVMESVFSP
jgi:tRNA A-37 threonylcarbamoyl transferase component Bud32